MMISYVVFVWRITVIAYFYDFLANMLTFLTLFTVLYCDGCGFERDVSQ